MQKPISTAYMRQKIDESYRNAVMKARKSEKALRQVQRQAYAEMITCATKTYDQYKECVDANMSLFELDPLKYEQIEAITERQNVSETLKKCTSTVQSRDLHDKLRTESRYFSKIPTPAANVVSSKGDRKYDVSIATYVPHAQSVAEKNNKNVINMNVTSDKDASRKIKFIASIPNSNTTKPLNQKGLQESLTSFIEVKKPKTCITNATSHGSLQYVRKRKREIDDRNINEKADHTKTQTVTKKFKLDTVKGHSDVSKAVIKTTSCIPIVTKKTKRETSNKVGLKATSSAQVACKRLKLDCNDKKSGTSKHESQEKDQIIMLANKGPQENKWIECKVNHPIKQSKSKIPLPIHKLGCKNESNLAAHLKRIGAYKRMKLIEPYSSLLLDSKVIDKM